MREIQRLTSSKCSKIFTSLHFSQSESFLLHILDIKLPSRPKNDGKKTAHKWSLTLSFYSAEKSDARHSKISPKIWLLKNSPRGVNVLAAVPFTSCNQRWICRSLENYEGCSRVLDSTWQPNHDDVLFLMSKQYLQPLRNMVDSVRRGGKHLSITSDRGFPPSWYDWREMSADMLSPQGDSLSGVSVGSCYDSPEWWVITLWPLRPRWAGQIQSEPLEWVTDSGWSHRIIPTLMTGDENRKPKALHCY